MNASTAFILCKPDLFLRALLPRFLSFLEENNFSIKKFFSRRMTESHFRLMYSTHFRWDVDDWHHNQKIYEFGPVLGLLLENSCVPSALNTLIQIKGAALPKDRKTDSIRYIFGSKSRLFNLIHVPDSGEQSEKEAINWFGVNELNDGYSCSSISKEEVLNEMDQNGYHAIGSLDPEYAFLKAKIRLMHAIQMKSACSHSFHSLLQNLKLFYSSWSEEISTSTLCNGIEGTILALRYKKERELLDAMHGESIAFPAISNAMHLLMLLTERPKFSTNFFWILEEWNVFVSALEHYLIVSRLKYN